MFNIFKKNDDISFIIYQMGKVGSSTLQHSLIKNYGEKKVFHTHIHQEAKEKIEKWRKKFDTVVVITGFREPLSRCISAYFQNLTNEKNHWYVGPQREVINKSVEWLITDYKTKVIPHIEKVIAPWLDNYEKAINCKFSDFNLNEGHWRFSSENTNFYLYKLETLNLFYQEMTKDPLLKNIILMDTNKGEDKWYSQLYKKFKNEFKISEGDYSSIYGNIDYLQNLYTEKEIKNYTKDFIF